MVMDVFSNEWVVEFSGNVDLYVMFVVNDVFVTSDGEVVVMVRDEVDVVVVMVVIGGALDGLVVWCGGRIGAEVMVML